MKTPILDEKIRDLENIKSLDEISEFGEEMLSEFKEIKKVLFLACVSLAKRKLPVAVVIRRNVKLMDAEHFDAWYKEATDNSR